MSRTVRAALLAVAVIAMVACSGQSDPGPEPEPEATSVRDLDCSNQIDILDEPPPEWRTVLDVIALPQHSPLQRGRTDEESGRRFTKFGLVIRADRAFSITVAHASSPNAVIDWNGGSAKQPVQSIEIGGCSGRCETDWQPDCPLGQEGRWIAYPGGVWTTEPACVTVEIDVDGEVATADLPIGVACA